MYQLTTLGCRKWSSFHLMRSCLGYTIYLCYNISKYLVYSIFNIILLNNTFPTVSQETQMEIVCKSYNPRKLMYQITTLRFKKLLVFHLQWSFLGYTIDKGMVYTLFTIVFHGETFPNDLSRNPK